MELVSCKKPIRIWWLVITSIFFTILIIPFFILSLSSLIGVISALIIDYKSVIDRDNIILIWDIATHIFICFITILNLHICLYTLFGKEEIYIDEEKLTVRKHIIIFHHTETIKLTDIIDITLDVRPPITNYGTFIVDNSNIQRVNIYLPGKFLFWRKRKHCGLNYNEDETRNLIVKIYEKTGIRKSVNQSNLCSANDKRDYRICE